MSRLGRAMVVVTPLLLVSSVLFGMSALRFYRYESGTPTTATVVRCEGGPKSRACYGAWNIGGLSQTGLIRGPSGPDGSSMEVRVNGGIAYVRSPVLAFCVLLALVVTLAILFTVFAFLLIRRWMRTKQ